MSRLKRGTYIGGHQMAAIVGMHPYSSIGDVYAKWTNRPERPWGLEGADTLEAFEYRCKVPGRIVTTSQFSAFTCPTNMELADRALDRKRIRGYVVDALHHVRCAEFGSTRLELYTAARRAWEPEPAH